MLLNKDTIAIQRQLAAYCRDGQPRNIEGARPDRLHNYRRLVFNIIFDSLSQAYPITRAVLSEEEWEQLINDFFTGHDPQSNQIWKMPYELYEYAEASAYHEKLKRPYLLELLYFEWVEIEVYCMPDAEVPPCVGEGDMVSDRIIVNPDYRLLHLTYPVHKRPAKELEEHRDNYFVLVFREADSGKVQFMELSPLFAFVFERLAEKPATAREAYGAAAAAFGLANTDELLAKGLPFIEALYQRGAAFGYQSIS